MTRHRIRRLPALLLAALIAVTAACTVRQDAMRLSSAAPEELGVGWRECALPAPYSDVAQAEACFDQPPPEPDAGDLATYASRTGSETLELSVGDRTCVTGPRGPFLLSAMIGDRYTLTCDGQVLANRRASFTAFSPNRSLQNVAGSTVWEVADDRHATVIQDGDDLTVRYGLDNAYAPAGLGDRLAFIGERDGVFFVVIDGHRVGPDYDDVTIAYCCEAMLYAPRSGQGRYLFAATREGRPLLVELSAQGPAGQFPCQ